MTRLVPLCAALVLSGCYTPQGAFIFVDDFALPATTEYRMAPGDLLAVMEYREHSRRLGFLGLVEHLVLGHRYRLGGRSLDGRSGGGCYYRRRGCG